jgi:hypothetical protein
MMQGVYQGRLETALEGGKVKTKAERGRLSILEKRPTSGSGIQNEEGGMKKWIGGRVIAFSRAIAIWRCGGVGACVRRWSKFDFSRHPYRNVFVYRDICVDLCPSVVKKRAGFLS